MAIPRQGLAEEDESREVNLDTRDRGDERIREVILLGKIFFFVDIFTCRGNLKGHLVLIPAMPLFWDTVICRNSGF